MIEITTNVSVLLVILTIMGKNVLHVHLHHSGIKINFHASLVPKVPHTMLQHLHAKKIESNALLTPSMIRHPKNVFALMLLLIGMDPIVSLVLNLNIGIQPQNPAENVPFISFTIIISNHVYPAQNKLLSLIMEIV